jgi:MFS family permease
MKPNASALVGFGMAAIAVGVALVAAWAYARAGRAAGEPDPVRRRRFLLALAVVGAWMAVTGLAAGSGVLAQFDRRPPPVMFVLLGTAAAGLTIGLSRVGARLANGLSLAVLVGIQSFRLPLELVMHRAAREGVMPVQMSFSGFNFDIVAGATAIVVSALLATGRAPRALAMVWNMMGAVLLVTVVVIGVVSLPMFAAFGSEPARLNSWLAYFPFVWLATVMVAAAFAGHLVIARKILGERKASRERARLGQGTASIVL